MLSPSVCQLIEKNVSLKMLRGFPLSGVTLLSNSIAANENNVACMVTLSSDGLTCFEHHEERTRSINREGFLK